MSCKTDRDRLIELLMKVDYAFDTNGRKASDSAEFVADYLLANSVIIPPCKVGDYIYIIDDFDTDEPYVLDVKVVELGQSERGKWITLDLPLGLKLKRYISWDDIGKTVFLTKEEAEQVLNKRGIV